MDPEGKIALVTGSARRVGRAILLALAEAGADVILHYHNSPQTEVEATLFQVRRLGRRAISLRADLTQRAEIERLFQQARETFGRLDILVNSAAVMEAGDVRLLGENDWDRIMDTNLKSPFFCSQEAVRLMGPQGGVIVNIADVAGLQGWARYPVHSVSKAGVLMLTRVLAKALGPSVRVNAVAPGPVAVPEDMDPARWERVAQHLLLQHAGRPEDIARAVLYLVREDFVTGTTLVVDGGALVG